MRIAFLADPLDTQRAGIHVYTQGILTGLTQHDTHNEYVIIRPQEGTAFGNATEVIAPIKSWLPMHARLRQFSAIPKIIANQKATIVVEPAHFGPFNLPKHIKRVTVIHDMTPILFPAYHDPMSHWMHRLFLPRIVKKADLIITVSESTRRDLIRLYPLAEGKTNVVLLGKDEAFKPKEDATILNNYNIDKPYFLSVSTLEPRKNLGLLIDAYHTFRKETGAAVQLVLTGKKGWNIDTLLHKIAESPYKDDIILTGFITKEAMATLYSMSLSFVFPSWYEGFGIPVLEAMSCGAAVIISKVSSLPEVGGDAALYFSPQSEQELVTHMKHVYEDESLRTLLSELSIQQAKQFSWERAAKETKILLDQLGA